MKVEGVHQDMRSCALNFSLINLDPVPLAVVEFRSMRTETPSAAGLVGGESPVRSTGSIRDENADRKHDGEERQRRLTQAQHVGRSLEVIFVYSKIAVSNCCLQLLVNRRP